MCASVVIPTELLKMVRAINHNPNKQKKYEVRLVPPGKYRLDNCARCITNDIIGTGETLEEATQDAFQELGKRGKATVA